MKAAFFLVGNYIETSSELVKRMVEEGAYRGQSHLSSSGHVEFPTCCFQEEIHSLRPLFKETTGQDMPKYYRPPQGKYSGAISVRPKIGI